MLGFGWLLCSFRLVNWLFLKNVSLVVWVVRKLKWFWGICSVLSIVWGEGKVVGLILGMLLI